MAIAALNVASTKDYVSTKDPERGPEGQPLTGATIWKLGAMDSYIEAHVSSISTTYNMENLDGIDPDTLTAEERAKRIRVHIDIYTMAIETVRLCLKGWTNFQVDGADVEFTTKRTNVKGRFYEGLDPAVIALIPKEVILDLYSEVQRISRLSEEERKN